MAILLSLKDYCPIDIKQVKRRWKEVMNIPNNAWEDLSIERSITVINDPEYPTTLRSFELNTLPVVVIRIIEEQKDSEKPLPF